MQIVMASFFGVNPLDNMVCKRIFNGRTIRLNRNSIRCKTPILDSVIVHMKTKRGTGYSAATGVDEDNHPNTLQEQN